MSCRGLNDLRSEMWDELFDIIPSQYIAHLHVLDYENDQYEYLIGAKIPKVTDLETEIRDKYCVIVARAIPQIYFKIKDILV